MENEMLMENRWRISFVIEAVKSFFDFHFAIKKSEDVRNRFSLDA